MSTVMLKQGDCLELLKKKRAESVDSIVTDPPAGISFMGKDWDDDKGGRDAWIAWLTDVMKECLRVLKPGGHALVWSIPRTSHWTATALENAGFEVRDCVTHLFGSGFPKSLDISKAIDKAAGAEREVVGTKKKQDIRGGSLNAEKKVAETGYIDVAVTVPATDGAKQWSGWGTALKPAAEFWWLVRKPLSEKTVAANVLKHGTGGLNIDGCRIGTETITTSINTAIQGGRFGAGDGVGKAQEKTMHTGRFPANLVLTCCGNDPHDDGCAVAELDRQSGIGGGGKFAKSGGRPNRKGPSNSMNSFNQAVKNAPDNYGDTGGASRFFYVAKASKADKGAGNSHPTVKSTKLMEYLIRLITPPGGIVLDPFMGSGSTGVAALRAGFGFIGIERETEYFMIAETRIKEAEDAPELSNAV